MPGSACVRTAIKEDAINPYMRREPFPVHCFRVLFRRHVKPFEISMRHRKCRFVSTIAIRSVVISSTRYCRRTSGLEWPIMFASLVQTTTRFRRRRLLFLLLNRKQKGKFPSTVYIIQEYSNPPSPSHAHAHTHKHTKTHTHTHSHSQTHTHTHTHTHHHHHQSKTYTIGSAAEDAPAPASFGSSGKSVEAKLASFQKE